MTPRCPAQFSNAPSFFVITLFLTSAVRVEKARLWLFNCSFTSSRPSITLPTAPACARAINSWPQLGFCHRLKQHLQLIELFATSQTSPIRWRKTTHTQRIKAPCLILIKPVTVTKKLRYQFPKASFCTYTVLSPTERHMQNSKTHHDRNEEHNEHNIIPAFNLLVDLRFSFF